MDLRELTRKERFCCDTLTNAATFMNGYEQEKDKNQSAGWIERLQATFKEFMDLRLNIDSLLEDEEEVAPEEVAKGKTTTKPTAEDVSRAKRAKFESAYMKVMGQLVEAEGRAFPKPVVAGSGAVAVTSGRQFGSIKLPEVKLPSFDGTFKEWPTFRDAFKSLIDSNPNLSGVDKLTYLNSALTLKAKQFVESIDITEANYEVAWEILVEHYDNKKIVVKSFLDALLSVEPIKRECYESLTQLIDEFERNLKMIQKMQVNTKGWSVLLAHMLCSLLDTSTLKAWENHHKSKEVPEYEKLITFLKGHCTVLQSLPPSKQHQSEARLDNHRKPSFSSIYSVTASASQCHFCSQPFHSPFMCDVFRKLSVPQRQDLVRKNGLCFNCLSADHRIKNCPSGVCRVCNLKHHTMLHQTAPYRNSTQSLINKPYQSQTTTDSPQTPIAQWTETAADKSSSQIPSTESTAELLSHCSTSLVANVFRIPSTVLLQTAVVKMFTSPGSFVWARALLDSASQLNIISGELAQKLSAQKVEDRHMLGGIGNSTSVSTHSIKAFIQSRCCSYKAELKFHVLDAVTREIPSNEIAVSEWSLPSNVVLADPEFNKPAKIDLIIGMETYNDLLLDGLIRLGPRKPVLQNTLLGWVVSGKVDERSDSETDSVVHVCSDDKLEQEACKFSNSQSRCLEHVAETDRPIECRLQAIPNLETYPEVTVPTQPTPCRMLPGELKYCTFWCKEPVWLSQSIIFCPPLAVPIQLSGRRSKLNPPEPSNDQQTTKFLQLIWKGSLGYLSDLLSRTGRTYKRVLSKEDSAKTKDGVLKRAITQISNPNEAISNN